MCHGQLYGDRSYVARGALAFDFAGFLIYHSAMRKPLKDIVFSGIRIPFRLAAAIGLLLLLRTSVPAQEMPNLLMPDSIHVVRDAFFVPSMSPYFSYVPPRFLGSLISPADQVMIDADGHVGAHNDAWKRSFLLGASVYHSFSPQTPRWTPGKPTFFQRVQAILGVAEFAGVAYLGYKAIKGEPITKRKDPKKK